MQVLRRYLASWGIGGVRISLAGVRHAYSRGEHIRGQIRIEGGSIPQDLRGIRVQLLPQNAKWSGYLPVTAAGGSIHVDARADMQVTFDLIVPDNADLGSSLNTIWILRATAFPRYAVILPNTENPVTIVPHQEVLTVHRALRQLGFGPATPISVSAQISSRAGTSVETWHEAPFALKEQIHGLTAHVAVMEQWVIGWVAFKHRPRTLSDGFEQLLRKPVELNHFQIPRADVLRPDGSSNIDVAVAALRSILRASLVFPDNVDEKTLLRAVSESGETSLLRPAEGTGTTAEDELLRPAEPTD